MMLDQIIGGTGLNATPDTEPPRGGILMVQRRLRWRRWRVRRAPEPELLTSAELSECTCPDLCQRDHGND